MGIFRWICALSVMLIYNLRTSVCGARGNGCPTLPAPLKGVIACDSRMNFEKHCTPHCNPGYAFAHKPHAPVYVCGSSGVWTPNKKVPDCSKTHHPETLLKGQLRYLADQCNEELTAQITSKFIALYTTYLRTTGGCNSTQECTIENVQFECGESSKQASKVPLTVSYALKVSLPSNTSVADLSQTTEKISSDILKGFNKTDLNLNISGIVIKLDTSKAPDLLFEGLLCDDGQVLRGTKCVNCPLGYFFNTTDCQACAVDQYQDQEAQTSCVSCPSGTSTRGAVASKWRKSCKGSHGVVYKMASLKDSYSFIVILLVVIAGVVSGLLIIFITRNFLRKRQRLCGRRLFCGENRRSVPHCDNPGFNVLEQIEIPRGYLPSTAEGADASVTSCLPPLLEVGNESRLRLHRPVSNCCSENETSLNNSPASRFKCITHAEDVFSSTGGILSAPDSDVKIKIGEGAIRNGINQPVFFSVIYDERTLLQDIPEGPDRTLISPVIECGPHDIDLIEPVEIVLPHCIYLGETKDDEITVYRTDPVAISWEEVPNESKKNSQSKAWFTVKEDCISIKTKTFSLWSIFACGGPKKKRATVFASQPKHRSDLIYFRFYVYSDNKDSKKRVADQDGAQFPESWQSREKPFKMYNDNREITVRLTDLEEGWELDKTDGVQVYNYRNAYSGGFRCKDVCDFAVKLTEGRAVKGFSCMIRFKQEGHDPEHTIYLVPDFPGLAPLKFEPQITRHAADSGACAEVFVNPCSNVAGRSTSSARGDHVNSCREKPKTLSDSPEKGPADCDSSLAVPSLGGDNEVVTERQCYSISKHVGSSWKNLLWELNMKGATIENLEEDHKKSQERCHQGLLKWMREVGVQKATTKRLCEALRLVGCSEAAEALVTLSRKETSKDSECQ